MKEEDVVIRCAKCGEKVNGGYILDSEYHRKNAEKKLYHYRCWYGDMENWSSGWCPE
jgi:hypothetical protein